MKKWEYVRISCYKGGLENILNGYGKNGWRVVGGSYHEVSPEDERLCIALLERELLEEGTTEQKES